MSGARTPVFNDHYRGRTVLVTGHTGFKGSWLSLWLRELGASVAGLALDPPTTPSLFEVVGPHAVARDVRADVRDRDAVRTALDSIAPDVVFHLAAQPLVRRSYAEPLETFETNVMGTANVLDAIRMSGARCAVVVVTSDKCYENREWEYAYRETDPLGGHDPYSASKAAAEIVAASYRASFLSNDRVRLATARAGNVIGGGDYATDRIVPDCVRMLSCGEPIVVRNPRSTRPWQHVLESLSGYLWLGARLAGEGGERCATAFNFGPMPHANRPVSDLVEAILAQWPGRWETPAATEQPHEATRLNLAIERAATVLGWAPVWDFETTVRETVAWYHARHVAPRDTMLGLTIEQIGRFVNDATEREIAWAKT